jgi:hypothetical protein
MRGLQLIRLHILFAFVAPAGHSHQDRDSCLKSTHMHRVDAVERQSDIIPVILLNALTNAEPYQRHSVEEVVSVTREVPCDSLYRNPVNSF